MYTHVHAHARLSMSQIALVTGVSPAALRPLWACRRPLYAMTEALESLYFIYKQYLI